MTPDSALQSTVIPLRGLPASELRRWAAQGVRFHLYRKLCGLHRHSELNNPRL